MFGSSRLIFLAVVVGSIVLSGTAALRSQADPPQRGRVAAADAGAGGDFGSGFDGGADCRTPWAWPVDAPVVDPFRPPDGPYGPGNRGLEFGAEAGTPVRAVADGSVRFSGPVGGAPVVVIDHGGELWSTFVGLQGRLVEKGQAVERNAIVATADAGLHLTARRNGKYLDPAILLARRCLVVRLVSVEATSSD